MDTLEKEIARACRDLRNALEEYEAVLLLNNDAGRIAKAGKKVTLLTDVLETLESARAVGLDGHGDAR